MGGDLKLVSATDESGQVLCNYKPTTINSKENAFEVIPSKPTTRSYAKALLDVFLPAGYPHTVTPDYTPYQVYDSLQAFSSTIAGLLSSRAVLQGFGVGDATSTATSAVLLTVLQESTGRLATILFAHRLGRAIEPECKYYRFLADLLNDSAMAIDLLTPSLIPFLSLPPFFKVIALCASGTLRALCGVAAGAAKASLSAHFARRGNNNLAELNAKDGSQETVISLMGMLAGSVFVRLVEGPLATMVWMAILIALHLWTNYRAVRAVQMRSLNRQRAAMVFEGYFGGGGSGIASEGKGEKDKGDNNIILRPDQVALREAVLQSNLPAEYEGISFASRAPVSYDIGIEDLGRFAGEKFVIVGGIGVHSSSSQTGKKKTIFLKEGATTQDALRAWLVAARGLEVFAKEGLATKEEEQEEAVFWRALTSARWDLETNALETGPAIRIRLE